VTPADRRDAADGRQTSTSIRRQALRPDSPEAAGTKIISESSGATPNIVRAGDLTFFAGSRSDAFFFDFDGITKLSRRGRNFTAPPSAASRRKPAWLIDHRLAFLLEGGHSTLRPQAAYRHS
jgi:hypothetical protein